MDLIDEVPIHWNYIPLKHICYMKGRIGWKGLKQEEFLDDKDSPYLITGHDIKNDKIDWNKCYHVSDERYLESPEIMVQEGDLLFTKDGTIGKILFIDKLPGKTSLNSHLLLIRPLNKRYISKFLYYVFKSQYFLGYVDLTKTGTTFYGVSQETMMSFKGFFPPSHEQQQIVKYLDEKTTQVDTLISITEKKIELLVEKRSSLINTVITKGLNPRVELKNSEVEWIGDIPKHWIISRLKYDSSTPVKYGLNISGEKYLDEGIRFIRITDLTEEGELILEDGKYLDETEVPNEFLLQKYDVLFCRSGHTVGKSYLHLEDGKYTSGGYLVRFNFRNPTESKFIFYLGKTHFYWDWIKLNSVISTIENVNGDKYQNFQYPKPPISEQQEIVTYLDTQTKEIDILVSIEQRRIETLKEYRQSLISEVVTGKIRVCKEDLSEKVNNPHLQLS